jgi:hypothetical protein
VSLLFGLDESAPAAACAGRRDAREVLEATLAREVTPQLGAAQLSTLVRLSWLTVDQHQRCVTEAWRSNVFAHTCTISASRLQVSVPATSPPATRSSRLPTVINAAGRTPDQLATCINSVLAVEAQALVTDVAPELYAALRKLVPGACLPLGMHIAVRASSDVSTPHVAAACFVDPQLTPSPTPLLLRRRPVPRTRQGASR